MRELSANFHQVLSGCKLISSSSSSKLTAVSPFSFVVKSLTAREHDVLKLICDGLSNREIGVALQIAETTARDHVHSVIHKLNARNRTACAVKSIRLQVVS